MSIEDVCTNHHRQLKKNYGSDPSYRPMYQPVMAREQTSNPRGSVYSHKDTNDIAFKQVIAADSPLLFVNGEEIVWDSPLTNNDFKRTIPHFTGEVPRLVAPIPRVQTIPTTSHQVPENLSIVDVFTQFSQLMREEAEWRRDDKLEERCSRSERSEIESRLRREWIIWQLPKISPKDQLDVAIDTLETHFEHFEVPEKEKSFAFFPTTVRLLRRNGS